MFENTTTENVGAPSSLQISLIFSFTCVSIMSVSGSRTNDGDGVTERIARLRSNEMYYKDITLLMYV